MSNKTLAMLRQQFFRQKYRFDQGMAYISIINFGLLVLVASDKLKAILGLGNISGFSVMFLIASFVGIWILGYFLDVVVKQQYMTEMEITARSPAWNKVYRELEEIKKEVHKL